MYYRVQLTGHRGVRRSSARDSLASGRSSQGGVKAAHVLQPDNNPQYIVVIHFFDTTEAAENFRTFLREQIWTSTDVRGLRSDPQAMIQHEVDAGP